MAFLLHLHGYNSSPQSDKVQQTKQWLEQYAPEIELLCPLLSPFPLEAVADITALLETRQEMPIGIVGSSMGGFYATLLAERYGVKAVLVNPAVNPHLLVEKYLGENANYYSGETFVLEPHHIEDFRSLNVETIKKPKNLLVLLQKGDEVLDYRHAEEKYRDCHLQLEEGGDHSFQNYQRQLPAIVKFFTA